MKTCEASSKKTKNLWKNKNMENEIKSHYSYTEVINWLEQKGLNYTAIISKSLKPITQLCTN
jgi:ferritin